MGKDPNFVVIAATNNYWPLYILGRYGPERELIKFVFSKNALKHVLTILHVPKKCFPFIL